MPGNVRETLIAFSKGKQVDIETANSTLLRLTKTNAQFNSVRLNTENDAADIGKGHEFSTQVFNTSWDATLRVEKYLTSVWAAWAFGFALGGVSEAPPNYTITPSDPVTDDILLKYFTYAEQIRPGGSAIIDRAAIGMAVSRLELNVSYGPGRASSTLAIDAVGSGLVAKPSGLSIPSSTAEFRLPSASLELTALSVNYVTLQRILDLNLVWENNPRMDLGFFPGSGFQAPGDGDSGAVRGRIWHGDRRCSFQFNTLIEAGSTEETKQLDGTVGTVTIHLSNGVDHDLLITLHAVRYSVVEIGDIDGLTKVQVTCESLYDDSNGIITVVVKTNVTGIAA